MTSLPQNPPPARWGYTLVEILVVIGIIVLIIAVSVPLLSVFSGARSVESAQNQLGALINSARNEAVTMQRVTGILFYRDPTSADRVSVLTVYASDPQNGDNPNIDVFLDTFTDRDPVTLPVGVGVQVVNNGTMVNGNRTGDAYIGFNRLPLGNTVNAPVGGVILFDGRGQLTFLHYGLRMGIPSGNGRVISAMGRIIVGGTIDPGDANFVIQNPNILSQVGFVAFNAEQFKNAGGSDDEPGALVINPSYPAAELNEEKWIDDNSVPFMINRYNGTLVKGE
jgi:type II secretory pathway pseudopilin PulG